MDIKKIKSLIAVFEDSKLSNLEIEEADLKIKLEKNNKVEISQVIPVQTEVNMASQTQATNIAVPVENSNYKMKAPLVGTFYSAQSPDAAPFANLNQKVAKGQILCIIEAMKVMNEIVSPVDGIVKKINAQNGDIIEYDQVLFEICE